MLAQGVGVGLEGPCSHNEGTREQEPHKTRGDVGDWTSRQKSNDNQNPDEFPHHSRCPTRQMITWGHSFPMWYLDALMASTPSLKSCENDKLGKFLTTSRMRNQNTDCWIIEKWNKSWTDEIKALEVYIPFMQNSLFGQWVTGWPDYLDSQLHPCLPILLSWEITISLLCLVPASLSLIWNCSDSGSNHLASGVYIAVGSWVKSWSESLL